MIKNKVSVTRLMHWLGEVPTTNARILSTIIIVFGTAVKYWLTSTWTPDGNWLMFLAAMAGIDTTHFWLKRATSWNPDATTDSTTPPAPPATK